MNSSLERCLFSFFLEDIYPEAWSPKYATAAEAARPSGSRPPSLTAAPPQPRLTAANGRRHLPAAIQRRAGHGRLRKGEGKGGEGMAAAAPRWGCGVLALPPLCRSRWMRLSTRNHSAIKRGSGGVDARCWWGGDSAAAQSCSACLAACCNEFRSDQ